LTQTYQNGYSYAYHALNIEHGFRYLPHRLFRRVLGIGASGRGTLLAQNAQQLELAGA